MKQEKNKTYCQSCNKETKPPFDDYCEKCCQEDYFLMKSKKELLINCIGCGEKRCVDETGWCDNCGGELYQRPDDNEKTIRERLKVYFAQTTPLLDYYKAGGKLISVDGQLSIDEVTKQIVTVLGKTGKIE